MKKVSVKLNHPKGWQVLIDGEVISTVSSKHVANQIARNERTRLKRKAVAM